MRAEVGLHRGQQRLLGAGLALGFIARACATFVCRPVAHGLLRAYVGYIRDTSSSWVCAIPLRTGWLQPLARTKPRASLLPPPPPPPPPPRRRRPQFPSPRACVGVFRFGVGAMRRVHDDITCTTNHSLDPSLNLSSRAARGFSITLFYTYELRYVHVRAARDLFPSAAGGAVLFADSLTR